MSVRGAYALAALCGALIGTLIWLAVSHGAGQS